MSKKDKSTVYGVGCLGLMSDGTKPKTRENGKKTKPYELWQHMLQRCYSSKYHEKCPTYKNVSVCDRWLVYANFLEDLPKIENYELWLNNDGYALDKDIKQQGVENKVYSLNTVMFVSGSDNSKERNERIGGYKIQGVHVKTGEKTKVFNSIREVERELSIQHSSLSYCLNGKRKSAGGYKWFKVK